MCPQVSLSGSDGERQPVHHRELNTRFWPQLTAASVYQHCLVSLMGHPCRWWRTLATDKVTCGRDQQLPWPMRGTNNNDWGENQPSEPVRSGEECAGSSGSQELHPENKQGWVVSSTLKGWLSILNGAREEALKAGCFLELLPSKFSFTERFL